jgi:hypothetical protein
MLYNNNSNYLMQLLAELLWPHRSSLTACAAHVHHAAFHLVLPASLEPDSSSEHQSHAVCTQRSISTSYTGSHAAIRTASRHYAAAVTARDTSALT